MYRLSRARRIVENAFGIMSQTWRIILNRIHAKPENINNIILVCCVLHNYLRMDCQMASTDEDISDSESETNIVSEPRSVAYDIRERIADWCVNEGDVNFQYNMI